MNIDEFRQVNPQYNDISDVDLAAKLHAKHYRDIPVGEFFTKFGVRATPPDDPGAFQAGLIGAGRTTDRLLKGVEQMWHTLRGSGEELARMEKDESFNTQAYAGLQKQHPVATTVGEVAPYIAALPAAGSAVGAAAMGAMPGLVEYGTGEERLGRGVAGSAGGLAGAGLGKLVGRAIQPFRPALSESQQQAMAAAERLGVKLRPGEIVQSRPLRWAESSLNDMPFASGMAQREEAARRAAINAGAARSIGQNATELTDEVLAQARTDIGGVFDTLVKNRRIELGPRFRADVAAIKDTKVMKSLRDDSVQGVIEPFQNLPAGKIKVTGEWFQQNKTALDTKIREAYRAGKYGQAQALEKFERALVDAAKDSMNTTEKAAYDAAQKQWASLRLLETGKVVEAGNVMPGRLDSALLSRYKNAYKEGKIKGDLADIGKLGQTYKPLPQSGTVPRAIYSAGAMGSALAHPALPLGLAVPPLAQAFMQSAAGRKYLTKGMADITPEIEKRLMQGGYGLLGAPLASGF